MKTQSTAPILLLLVLSLGFQSYSLLISFRSFTSLTADLFEAFLPLGYWYFIGGCLLTTAILLQYTRERSLRLTSLLFSLLIANLLMYKLLPKYVYYMPLQREIYHTANIMYVYRYHNINTSRFPSMPESVGYAIFYAALGMFLGFEPYNFTSFLTLFTDMFHLMVIVVINFIVLRAYRKYLEKYSSILIVFLPIIFMLQINSTYRNGFATLLAAYAVVTMLMFSAKPIHGRPYALLIALFLSSSAISYPGVVPLITVAILSYLTLLTFLKSMLGIKNTDTFFSTQMLYIAAAANMIWFSWQLSRYPKLYNALKLYINSLLDLIRSEISLEALTVRYKTYNIAYSTILTLRTIYAFAMLATLGVLSLIALYRIFKLRWGGVYKESLLTIAFVFTFSVFVLVGAKGNFHFAAVYNIFSSSSALLTASLIYALPSFKAIDGARKKSGGYRWSIEPFKYLVIGAYCFLLLLSPIVLWPAFKNLMPIELKEVAMFNILGCFEERGSKVGYLGLYGGTMGTAIQYVFADRPDTHVFGIPYPIEEMPNYETIVTVRNIVSSQSKVKFEEHLNTWLDRYLGRLMDQGYNKVVDLGGDYSILTK